LHASTRSGISSAVLLAAPHRMLPTTNIVSTAAFKKKKKLRARYFGIEKRLAHLHPQTKHRRLAIDSRSDPPPSPTIPPACPTCALRPASRGSAGDMSCSRPGPSWRTPRDPHRLSPSRPTRHQWRSPICQWRLSSCARWRQSCIVDTCSRDAVLQGRFFPRLVWRVSLGSLMV